MSGRLVSAILESALDPRLKPYAMAFASFAKDDGSHVFPSMRRIARDLGKSARSVQRAVTELRRLRVLEVVAPSGRCTATRYQFHAERLPLGGDGEQLPLLLGFLDGAQRKSAKAGIEKRFPQRPQALTGHPRHPRGDTSVTRSVNRSVKYSPYTRAREKTGTA